LVSYRAVRRLIDNDQEVTHANQVLLELGAVLSTLKDAETGARGYVITGEDSYLQPYETALAEISERVDKMKQLAAGNRQRRARIPEIENRISAKLQELSEVIALRRTGDLQGAQNEVRSGSGKQLMDELRRTIAGMESDEHQVLEQTSRETRTRRRDLVLTLVAANLVACTLLVLVCLIVVRDLADRKRAEKLLRQEREWLRVTLASIGDGVLATDRAGSVAFMNAVAEALTGWTQAEANLQPLEKVFNIVNEQTRNSVDNPALKAMEQGVVVGLANHTVLISRNGDEVPVDDSGAPIKDSAGNTIGAVLIFRDVAARRKAEQVQTLLAGIVESSQDAIISKDLDGRISSWNAGAERIFGYSAEEAIGGPVTMMIPADRLEEEAMFLERIRQDRKIERYETIRLAKGGAPVDVSLTVSPVRDALGRVVGASKIARDITAEKRAAEMLRQQHEWFQVTLSSIGDAVIATDTGGCVTFMNSVAESMTKWTQKDAEGQPVEQVFNIANEQTGQQVENPVLRAIREGAIVGLANHTILISRDGTEIAIDDSGAPIKDSAGNTVGPFWSFATSPSAGGKRKNAWRCLRVNRPPARWR
ncbi:MAG: PAS domain S-box protein, partial [Blastocatellia bacterium]